jgi:hypothetical protein
VSGQKDDWILLALKERPLDRLHLMKALFLTWHRSGRNIPNYFAFEPYLYGPCSFDAYRVLDAMSKEQLITQPSEPLPRWAKFYLTEKGKRAAAEAAARAKGPHVELLTDVVREVAQLGFSPLLARVYAQAPDFAVNSVARRVFAE